MMKPNPFFTSNHLTVPTNIGPPTIASHHSVEPVLMPKPRRLRGNIAGRSLLNHACLCLHEVQNHSSQSCLLILHPRADATAPGEQRPSTASDARSVGGYFDHRAHVVQARSEQNTKTSISHAHGLPSVGSFLHF